MLNCAGCDRFAACPARGITTRPRSVDTRERIRSHQRPRIVASTVHEERRYGDSRCVPRKPRARVPMRLGSASRVRYSPILLLVSLIVAAAQPLFRRGRDKAGCERTNLCSESIPYVAKDVSHRVAIISGGSGAQACLRWRAAQARKRKSSCG